MNDPVPHEPVRRWWFAWLATFFAFVAVAHGNFETTDAGFTLQAARGLFERGESGLRLAEQGATSRAEQAGAWYIRNVSCGKVGVDGIAYTWFPVGHVWLLVPCVAAGEALGRVWPAAETAFATEVGRTPEFADLSLLQGTPVLTQGLVSLVVPAGFAATTLLLLVAIARQLGASTRAAFGVALAILFATQAFAFGRETLSDGPGLTFLLAALLSVVAVHQGRGTRRTAWLGGLAAGAVVLLRYQNAALVVGLGVALLLACRRQRRWGDFAAFALGCVPAMLLLFAANHARFGDLFDTGYPKASDWLDQPIWLGTTKILFGAGRGVAWLSPLVWLALPFAGRARHVPQLRWLGWAMFLFPLLFFAQARGWQGGQCWAARYVTHGLVALLAITLPQAQPWRHWPRTWWALVAAGILVAVTSVVAPVRGMLQLGDQAVKASGQAGDSADLTGWHLRYTPLLANWRYAFASRVGGFEDDAGRPRHGDGRAIETVFGVAATNAEQAHAPVRWEDRCGRHLWWRFWSDLTGLPGWLLLAPVVLLAGLAAGLAWRSATTAASDSSTAR